MQFGDAVDVGATGGGEVCHADLGVLLVGDDAHALDLGLVTGLGLEFGKEVLVDLVDDFHVAGQQFGDQLGRPDFQRLGQQGVAGVVEGLGGDGPGGVPVVAVLVDEDAHELGDADDGVGVVELEGDLAREGGQVGLALAGVEHADGVVQGRGHEEVLLFEAQRLALRGGILRVENLGDVLGLDLRLDGVEVFGLVEGEQVEFVVALGAPQAQRVDAAGCVAGDHVVDGHGAHGPGRLPDLLAVLFDDFAAEGDLLGTVVVDVAPGLFVGQPVVRLLDLLAVLVEGLLEDAVLVLDAVTERGHAEGRERVDEAGGETAEAAVAEARLVFDVDDVLRLEAQVLDGFVELVDHAGVEQCVTQLLAHEELGGQVSDGLGVAIDHVLLGLEPCVLQVVADHQRGGDVHVGGGGLLDGDALAVLQLFADAVRELGGRDRRLGCSDFSHV